MGGQRELMSPNILLLQSIDVTDGRPFGRAMSHAVKNMASVSVVSFLTEFVCPEFNDVPSVAADHALEGRKDDQEPDLDREEHVMSAHNIKHPKITTIV